jgi:ComF family protein
VSSYALGRFLIDVVYPNRCPFCDCIIAHNAYYCPGCRSEDFGAGQFCCAKVSPPENIAELFTVFDYNEQTSSFVYALKDGGNGYAVSAAAKLLCEQLEGAQFDLITCIPTDKSRLRERGYNPPALIAREMSAILGFKCDVRFLTKTRFFTHEQKSLSARERRENIKGAFALREGAKFAPMPETVLLIDDVRTTGATLSEAAEVLLDSGVKRVSAGVVAVVE